MVYICLEELVKDLKTIGFLREGFIVIDDGRETHVFEGKEKDEILALFRKNYAPIREPDWAPENEPLSPSPSH